LPSRVTRGTVVRTHDVDERRPMYAMVRRYRTDPEDVDEVAHRVDTEFAEVVSREPGFCDYQVVDCGDGTTVSISIFADEEAARRSNQLAAEWVGQSLADIRFERVDAFGGEVLVSRAADAVLEPAHH
jgi:quinol monooxygenase YgiN